MFSAIDARQLEREIRLEYEARCARYPDDDHLGWRLLYSPEHVLTKARLAFLGLNPGGSFVNPAHGVFSMASGSAYDRNVEAWGTSSVLQDQVVALFQRLGVQPDEVLAGNLVPFRSPSEDSLRDSAGAISFGRSIWSKILAAARPSIVISMGGTANRAISQLLGAHSIRSHNVGWGSYSASRGKFSGGTWIGLPHLSRFSIMKRKASQPALKILFDGLNDR